GIDDPGIAVRGQQPRRVPAAQLAYDPLPGPERRRAAVDPATGARHREPLAGGAPPHLVAVARLPDPRLPRDDERAPATVRCRGTGLGSQPELAGSADERARQECRGIGHRGSGYDGCSAPRGAGTATAFPAGAPP